MISVTEAIEVVLGVTKPLPPENVSLLGAAGRVLTQDLVAPRDLPPRPNAAMDGFAFRHEDLASGARLAINSEIPAGTESVQPVGPGQAAKIMTGAAIPPGADTVVPVEDTRSAGGEVEVLRPPSAGAHIRPAGEDVRKHDVVMASGFRLRPADVGMLAALGYSFVSVHRRPRVAILSTGDEIADVGQATTSGRIGDANSFALAALVADAGGDPIRLGIVPDDPTALTEVLRGALTADVVLTSGGVSAGDRDYMRPVFAGLGVDVKFAKVAIKPGKPLVFGTLGDGLVFGLPGNPVAAAVGFEVFVRPALLRLQGRGEVFRPLLEAMLAEEAGAVWSSRGRLEFLRCRVERQGNELRVTRVMKPGSGLLSSLVRANAFLLMPEDVAQAAPGTRVRVQIFDESSLQDDLWIFPSETEDGRATSVDLPAGRARL